MTGPHSISDDIVERGRVIYDRDLRARLEAEHSGRFAALDPDSGEYAVADDELGAVHALRERLPGVRPFIIRIGASVTYRIGARAVAGRPR